MITSSKSDTDHILSLTINLIFLHPHTHQLSLFNLSILTNCIHNQQWNQQTKIKSNIVGWKYNIQTLDYKHEMQINEIKHWKQNWNTNIQEWNSTLHRWESERLILMNAERERSLLREKGARKWLPLWENVCKRETKSASMHCNESTWEKRSIPRANAHKKFQFL